MSGWIERSMRLIELMKNEAPELKATVNDGGDRCPSFKKLTERMRSVALFFEIIAPRAPIGAIHLLRVIVLLKHLKT